MKLVTILALSILTLAQWFVPGNMMIEMKRILSKGKAIKMQTAPIDPYDQFRGKFINLSFKENKFSIPASDTDIKDGNEVYILLKEDEKGFSKISKISNTPFRDDELYIKARVNFESESDSSRELHFEFPFDRFYMEETAAPKADEIYRENNRDTSKLAYALIYVWKGDAAIKDVFVNDTSINTLVKMRSK